MLTKRRKVDAECRDFSDVWTEKYFFTLHFSIPTFGDHALRPVSTTSVEKSILCLFYCFFFALASILTLKGPFPLRAWKRAFFLSFIDLRLKRAVKIEASVEKKQ